MRSYKNKDNGFTLIETIVIVGVLGIIMVTTTNILVNAFRARNRLEVSDIIESDGASVLRELRNNVINGASVGATCATTAMEVGSTLSIVSLSDGVVTNLVCYEGSKIASESANGRFDLTSSKVKISGCDDFVRCDPDPDAADKIKIVNFYFNISAGDSAGPAEGYRQRGFGESVVPRN